MIKLVKSSLFYIIISLIFFISFSKNLLSQEEKPILIGKFSLNEWLVQTGWDNSEFMSYNPPSETINKIINLMSGNKITFLIFGGSWCSDTKSELPKIIKIFSLCGLDIETIEIIGVDRQKSEPSGQSMLYQIERVPTLIVLSNGNEIGRITEFPLHSWEDDLVKILETI